VWGKQGEGAGAGRGAVGLTVLVSVS